MSHVTHDIVAKLWNLCNILKDDGVTYHQYVTELTYLLFLKMAEETGTEDQLPVGYRWADLEARAAPDRLEFYKIRSPDLMESSAIPISFFLIPKGGFGYANTRRCARDWAKSGVRTNSRPRSYLVDSLSRGQDV